MKLYDFAFSPNSMKVRAVGYELGLTFEHVPVDLVKGASRTPAFLEINPNGRVPVLVDGDFVLWESVAILKYLSNKRDGALVPKDPRGQAEMDRWLAWQLAHLQPAMRKVAFERIVKKLTGQGPPNDAVIAEGTAEFGTLTEILDRALGDKDYLAGSLSLADFALAAHYRTAELAGLDVAPFKRARVWLGRMLARESMRRALADAHETMKSHAA
jgi:glutathione S-transferase